jgi:hypothetical protein
VPAHLLDQTIAQAVDSFPLSGVARTSTNTPPMSILPFGARLLAIRTRISNIIG